MSKRCLKCGTNHNITDHHIVPKVHCKGSNQTVNLCRTCHNRLEDCILAVEAYTAGLSMGIRYRLPDEKDYFTILASFIGLDRWAELIQEGSLPRHYYKAIENTTIDKEIKKKKGRKKQARRDRRSLTRLQHE